ncbi:S53 family peptidase [Chondromyces apiculatus]|uniref:Pseudomonapepsin n=1 Tax=Chondromyces apiculatus DSM 436 TaxID=1192034 RepID=A0A017T9S6_9BACT|nr:S53 family serine peptidase [Chondromyces apiculatus]EYF05687.1 pseudomonapepsin precursor [Chondromyces apiculatus DSM 436]
MARPFSRIARAGLSRAVCLGLTAALGAAAIGCGGDGDLTTLADGLPRPMEGVYFDFGAAEDDDALRVLVGFDVRDRQGLVQRIDRMYDPESAEFRDYMSPDDWNAQYAPAAEDVEEVASWLEEQGFSVDRKASNRLILQVSGTVGTFNTAFTTELRSMGRENHTGGSMVYSYGLVKGAALRVPQQIAERMLAVVTADEPADTTPLQNEGDDVVTEAPPDDAASHTLTELAGAYNLTELHAAGHKGAGEKLGIFVGATFLFRDLQSFWTSMGVTRAAPEVVNLGEDPSIRYLETTIDVEWAGGLAPEADLTVYQGADARNTSLIYAFNEMIARGEVSVVSNSFARREDAEPAPVREQYNMAAMQAAAMGITVVVASGNSAETDTPSSSAYVTAIGGTVLSLDENGQRLGEVAWDRSGSGPSLSMRRPSWQEGVVPDSTGMRAVVDVALNASPDHPYIVYYLSEWSKVGGTSLATPAFAGMITCLNSERRARGLPPVGLLNPLLYRDAKVQAAFRDMTEGATPFFSAGPGWDYPTGWGSPDIAKLAAAIP